MSLGRNTFNQLMCSVSTQAANAVALGKTRAREQSLCSGSYCSESKEPSQPGEKVLCLQIHGDAAFTGQGVVAETLVLADVPHFTVGGSVHFIINNQIGYTTEANLGRSSLHCSDVGLMNGCPIIHVSGDYPEEVVKACRLAMDYRHRYHRDVFVNYVCFRRWGHNEMDEPAFTQPLMYRTIRTRSSIPDRYADKLQKDGVCDLDTLTQAVTQWNAELQDNLKQVDTYVPQVSYLKKHWQGLQYATHSISTWDTGLDSHLLQFIGAKSVSVPSHMSIHPTLLKTHIDRRLQQMELGHNIDWATAEALAIGSLLYQGFHVRLSGQDVGRGTFSHRHAMMVDQDTDAAFIPLNSLLPHQTAFLEMANSPLSEEAVVAFEYGMSIEHPQRLVMWEAQFGDFSNGAQIITDTCITGGETKWMLQSGLVMLLPHGLDGAGPEHSSCRIERFLQLSDSKEDGVDGDNVNIQVVNPTTPAQYYHLLRRQMVRNFRKPLVVAAPKILLRHPLACSQLSQMSPGTSFQPVLGDTQVVNKHVTRVVFVSGKHYYTLQAYRQQHDIKDTALVRVELLCPFPAEEIQQEVAKYVNAKEFFWSQEEHSNQGAWSFIAPRFENIIGKKVQYTGRCVLATPAAGIGEVHREEAEQLLADAFLRAKQ
ncbi:putative 2-oxoglutarate dehydrogenase E1 component DHKTD1, mitochondrial [Lamellibrachia satsuma]|nr:putative 2-oxoglutarate dehydrogenase E1 component DHKTD1, mitochondrial [Lamellibrachia satsuma]